MRYWLDQGWADHDIRHVYSLRDVERNDEGKIARASRGMGAETPENLQQRDLKRAFINGRKGCQGLVCLCEYSAHHKPMCPMRRPSRTLTSEEPHGLVPW
eukprot:8189633-Pyramimonas_sp.AAC.1